MTDAKAKIAGWVRYLMAIGNWVADCIDSFPDKSQYFPEPDPQPDPEQAN